MSTDIVFISSIVLTTCDKALLSGVNESWRHYKANDGIVTGTGSQ